MGATDGNQPAGKLKVMHDEFRRLSDDELLLPPVKSRTCSWAAIGSASFRNSVNWTLNRPEGKPFVEEIAGSGKVSRGQSD